MEKISVIVPTYNRQKHYRNLILGFLAQTYPNTELLICDDSEAPSDYLRAISREHRNITYLHHSPVTSIGEKRNILIHLANGEIIAQFDDDDYYAPSYLETMYTELQQRELDFITLSRWFAYAVQNNTFAYWETDHIGAVHFALNVDGSIAPYGEKDLSPGFVTNNLWGYGFSYMFRKKIIEQVQFQNMNFGEDFDFYQRLVKAGFKAGYIPDEKGLVLHMLHPNSTSRIFPQCILPNGLLHTLFPGIKPYLANLD